MAGFAQAADLALQHRLQSLEHALDTPARAIQLCDPCRTDLLGQVAPQPDHALARFGRRIQRELDAPPPRARDLDRLFAHLARPGAAASMPIPLPGQPGMAGVLAHDEAGVRLVPALHDHARAEVAVGDPQLPRLRAVQQRRNRSTLALVRVLAGHDVGDQAAVRVVDHQCLPRQRRTAVFP